MFRSASTSLSGPTPLFVKSAANMQSTADQSFTKAFSGNTYMITHVVARVKTGGVTVACAGGIYTGAAKTGNALVAAAQSWTNLTAAGKIVSATVAAINTTDEQSATPILSLTTGSTGACTADVTIYGVILS